MDIYNKIRNDIKKYMKSGDTDKVKELKIVIGEVQRLRDKIFDDNTLINVIKKRINEIDEILNQNFMIDLFREHYLNIIILLKSYIPKEVSKNEILNFIKTIDFSKLKSPKQAMGIIKKHFHEKNIDMKKVSDILDDYVSDKK